MPDGGGAQAEAGGSLSLRPAWSTVPGQPELHRETLARKQTNKLISFGHI